MKQIGKYLLLLLAITSCNQDQKYVDWYRYYDSRNKQPFGTHILRKELPKTFSDAKISNINKSSTAFFEGCFAKRGVYEKMTPTTISDKTG